MRMYINNCQLSADLIVTAPILCVSRRARGGGTFKDNPDPLLSGCGEGHAVVRGPELHGAGLQPQPRPGSHQRTLTNKE